MDRPISVLIVDDSAFMRKALSLLLESDPGIRVVATARNGAEGIEKIREVRPDVVTMDIEMPVMDGLTALRTIMKESPLPVIMVSSLTMEGAAATIEALSIGAVDFIPKASSHVSIDIARIRDELIAKIRNVSRTSLFRLRRLRLPAPENRPVRSAVPARNIAVPAGGYRAVVLAVSTGGPFALLQTIPRIRAGFPLGIAVVQHMPPHFTKSMADRLDGSSALHVKEAEEGDPLSAGTVLIAPGGRHMTFVRNGLQVRAHISEEPNGTLYRPCADVMIESAVRAINGPVVGVIMTGMGRDGVSGLKLAKDAGGYVIAQDEATCVVYGMPKAAVDAGIADAVVPLDEIPSTLEQAVLTRSKRTGDLSAPASY